MEKETLGSITELESSKNIEYIYIFETKNTRDANEESLNIPNLAIFTLIALTVIELSIIFLNNFKKKEG